MRAAWTLIAAVRPPAAVLRTSLAVPKGRRDRLRTLIRYDIERLHTFSDGRTKDRGHTYFDALIVNTDFSITDRLAVSVSLPYMAGKYVGPFPHLLVRGQPSTATVVDNGEFHSGFQDFRLNVRYALTRSEWKVTPLFQAVLPSHDYPSFGHAAIGFNEKEYRVGVNIGRRLNPILPKAFVQGQYAFGFSPLVAANIAPKRSYGELQLGYLLTRRFSFQGSSVLTWSHNGVDIDYDLLSEQSHRGTIPESRPYRPGQTAGRERLNGLSIQPVHKLLSLCWPFVLRHEWSSSVSGDNRGLHESLQYQAVRRKRPAPFRKTAR